MNIGVDATSWQNNRGYGRHARALLRALLDLDTENRYTFFMDSKELLEMVPPRAEVKASFRLVPVQDPERIKKLLKAAVRELSPDVKIQFESAAPAFRTVLEGPLPQALKRSIKFAFERDAVFVRDGGTIGAMTSIENVLKCPVLFLGLSLPEHGYHAPNEYFDWGQASGGMKAFAHYFAELAKMGKR